MDMATGKNYARWADGSDTYGLNRSSGIVETEQEDKDSIKVLTAWDEAISQRVGEALKLGNNLDFKEVEI